jgi:DNA-binding transcriptional LysR family regulator
MDTKLLKCFVTVADELHFGRAAQRLDMLPSALGRNIRLLEEELGIRLFVRTTRNVSLTRSGMVMLQEFRPILKQFDTAIHQVREKAAKEDRVFRIGSIDSAATGLLPELIHDLKAIVPGLELAIEEDKTAKLLPKLLSGALDLAFIRPPTKMRDDIHFEFLLMEKAVVALASHSDLADKEKIYITDLSEVPMIVPSPRNRPHSYNLTNRLFLQSGVQPNYVQQAEEKQTIVNLVAAEVGAAIVPEWTAKLAVKNVVFRPLMYANDKPVAELPLALAWVKGTTDRHRETLLAMVKEKIKVEMKA